MNTKVLTLLILSLTSAAFSEDFKTTDGKEYKDVTVSNPDACGITVTDKKAGLIVKLYFTQIPKEVQEQFHYDAKKCEEYSAAQAAQVDQENTVQALHARYQELERREDELLLKIGEGEVGTYSGSPNPLRPLLPLLHQRLDEVRREKTK